MFGSSTDQLWPFCTAMWSLGLNTENRIRKMAEIFQRILEQAKTWHEPEVIDLTPKPLLSALEDENAVAG
jgi:hypothetical protein